jgi:TetR/AcrR family transcriptional regulator, transcriptional repressor for nem operon
MKQTSDTRDRLLDTALDLIYSRSYAGVGVQELCDQAKIKKGSFYHFFESKQDLVLAAIDRQWETVRGQIFDAAFTKELPPLARIERCFDRFYESLCATKAQTGKVQGCPFGNLAVELSTQDTAVRRRVDRVFEDMAAYMEAALRDAVRAGEIPDQDVARTAKALIAYKQGVMLLAKSKNDPEVMKHLRGGFLRHLVAGSAEPEGQARR